MVPEILAPILTPEFLGPMVSLALVVGFIGGSFFGAHFLEPSDDD